MPTWESLLSGYTSDESLIQQGFALILTRYSEPHRFYHNLGHIQSLLLFLEGYNYLVKDPERMQLAIFCHDLIYDAQRGDNEELSALAAIEYLEKTAYPADKIALVAEYIRATKTHLNPEGDEDLDRFLDFDLFILSAPENMYLQYAKNIRKEYAVYPDDVYIPGRKKVLQHFLDMPAIYKTPSFRERFDEDARENMRRELAHLE